MGGCNCARCKSRSVSECNDGCKHEPDPSLESCSECARDCTYRRNIMKKENKCPCGGQGCPQCVPVLKPCPFCREELVLKASNLSTWWAHEDEIGPCELSPFQLFDEADFVAWNNTGGASCNSCTRHRAPGLCRTGVALGAVKLYALCSDKNINGACREYQQ